MKGFSYQGSKHCLKDLESSPYYYQHQFLERNQRKKKKYKQQQNANIRVSFKHWYLPENKFSPLTATGRVAGFLLQPMNVLLSVSYEAKVYETNEVAAKVQLPFRYQPRR